MSYHHVYANDADPHFRREGAEHVEVLGCSLRFLVENLNARIHEGLREVNHFGARERHCKRRGHNIGGLQEDNGRDEWID